MTRDRLIPFLRVQGSALFVIAAALVLLYTGSAKLLGPSAFAQTIEAHGLIPRDLSPHVAWGVIAMELSVGTSALWLVLAERRTRAAAIGAGLVFAAFAWYAGAMVLFPPPAPTGCGGAGSASTEAANWGAITGRNSALAAALLVFVPAAARWIRSPSPAAHSPR